MRALLVCALLLTACAVTKSQVAGSVAAEGRAFILPPKYPGQEYGHGVSLVVEPKFSLDIRDGTHRLAVQPFYRLDSVDAKRSHADVRQADYRLSLRGWSFGLGAGQFSWGVLESYRPTDVLNQTDFVERVDGAAKLGQPYALIGWASEKISVTAFYLPYFRERTYQGLRGRPRGAVVIDTAHPEFETRLKQWQPSGAVRVAIHQHGVDFGVGLFTGLSREPRFVLQLTSLDVAPRYETMHRAFADFQWSHKAFTLKAEGFFCIYSERLVLFGGGGVGIDYTFASFVKDADLTIAIEALFDTRRDTAPLTFFSTSRTRCPRPL